MCSGSYAVEVLSSFFKGCNLYLLDSQGLFGGFVTSWNKKFDGSNFVSIPAGLIVERRSKGSDKVLKFVNMYAPYSERNQLWETIKDQ